MADYYDELLAELDRTSPTPRAGGDVPSDIAPAMVPRAPTVGGRVGSVYVRHGAQVADDLAQGRMHHTRAELPEFLRNADLETGAPASVRGVLGFKATPDEKLRYLMQQYGEGNVASADGNTMFFREGEGDTWKLTHPPRDWDIAGAGASLVRHGPAVVAGAATANPLIAGAVASGVGSLAAEGIDMATGGEPRLLERALNVGRDTVLGTVDQVSGNILGGIPRILGPKNIAKRALRNVLAGGTGDTGAKGAFKELGDIVMGRDMPAINISDEVLKREQNLKDAGYTPSLGTVTDSPGILQLEKLLQTNANTRAPFDKLRTHNRQRLTERRKDAMNNVGAFVGVDEVGRKIQSAYDKAAAYNNAAQKAADEVKSIFEMGGADPEMESVIGKTLYDEVTAYDKNKLRSIRAESHVNFTRAIDNIPDTFQFITPNAENVLKVTRKTRTPFTPPGGLSDMKAKQATQTLRRLYQGTLVPPKKPVTRDAKGRFLKKSEIEKPKWTRRGLTVNEFQLTLSDYSRKGYRGPHAGDASPAANAILNESVRKALLKDLDLNIERGLDAGIDVEALRHARDVHREGMQEHQAFKKYVRENILNNKAYEGIVHNLAAKMQGSEIQRFIVNINKVSPELSLAARHLAVANMFKPAEVYDIATKSKTLHPNTFAEVFSKNRNRLRALLADSPNSMAQLESIAASMQAIGRELERNNGQTLLRRAAENVVESMLDHNNPAATRLALESLQREAPELVELVQRHGVAKLMRDTDKAGMTGVASPTRVGHKLADQQSRDFLDALFLGDRAKYEQLLQVGNEANILAQPIPSLRKAEPFTVFRRLYKLGGAWVNSLTGYQMQATQAYADLFATENFAKLVTDADALKQLSAIVKFPTRRVAAIKASKVAAQDVLKAFLDDPDYTEVEAELERRRSSSAESH
jgi:hypothetical protein